VWFLTGLWHGSQPHYIVASLYNGIFIALCIFTKKYNIFKNISSLIKIICTFVIVSVGALFFRIPTVTDAINILKRIFYYPFSNDIVGELHLNIFSISQWCVVIISVLILFIVDYIKATNKTINTSINIKLIMIYLLLLSIVLVGKFGTTTFIYLNF
jgi:D-alanyl-lipoteichoic acid acyltransferase DltB (MBOAT superfamily)